MNEEGKSQPHPRSGTFRVVGLYVWGHLQAKPSAERREGGTDSTESTAFLLLEEQRAD